MTLTPATAPILLALVVAGPNFSSAAALTVRIADAPDTRALDVATALDEARTILGDAGVAVTWLNCRAGVAGSACQLPLGDGEVIVRLGVAHAATDARIVTMGVSLVGPAVRHSVLATVYVDLVELVARNASIDMRRLLGRAVAHEIGHLLLNTNTHAHKGLMRATWSKVEMQRNARADWLFADREAEAMRARISMSRQ
jgi:hypothetical protein